jgi:DNA-directed RNA polymerase specialized sigma24 family protein
MTSDKQDRMTLSEVEAAITQLMMNAADWCRAEKLAQFAAAGLSGMTGDDLLQETIVKLLSGERRCPRGHHLLVVLCTAMRSEASNARKRSINGPIDERVMVMADGNDDSDEPLMPLVESVDTRTPENTVIARNQIDFIFHHLEGDEELELVAMAWADGLRGKDAADEIGMDMQVYDAARNRMNRKLASLAKS